MGSGRQEVELKFRLGGADPFGTLLGRLGIPSAPRAALQRNHFFDTEDLALFRARITLRVREEEGVHRITAKGAAGSDVAGPLSVRAEEEVEVAPELGVALARGEGSPLAALRAGLEGDARLEALVGPRPLVRVGGFENERARLGPLVVPGTDGPEVVLELDTTRFPGRLERELEVELPGTEEADALHRALSSLLAGAGVDWDAAPSKAQRFFATLGLPERAAAITGEAPG